MSKWLVTGGAGYIGSHIVRDLLKENIEVLIIDDLSTGIKEKIPTQAQFFQGTLLDNDFLKDVFNENTIDGIVHLAAKKSVGESVERPTYYFEENIGGLLNLIHIMQEKNINNFVYSSSAAVYGEPTEPLVSEATPTVPTSPYGETKLIGEWLLQKQEINSIILRYFNVAGAASKDLADTAADNVIPKVFKALDENRIPEIFGDDYPTPDGTCIRDYVHVSDLSKAHVLAVKQLQTAPFSDVFNVGTGTGVSVKELFQQIQKSIESEFEYQITSRRAGDPAATVADVKKIAEKLSFKSQLGLAEMVDSAWQAWQFRSRKN